MANTYQLISSNVLGSSAASVTFSSIPSTYTDLVVKFSARIDRAVTDSTMQITTNVSGSVYSGTRLRGNGSAVSTAPQTASSWEQNTINAGTSLANTFTNGELYFCNYALTSTNKPVSYFATTENNATLAYIDSIAQLLSSTTAITSVTFGAYGFNFVAGSSFYLYGIKNS
jgi:hypothetical protein